MVYPSTIARFTYKLYKITQKLESYLKIFKWVHMNRAPIKEAFNHQNRFT